MQNVRRGPEVWGPEVSWASYSSLPSSDILTLFHASPTQQIKFQQYSWLNKALSTSTRLYDTLPGSRRRRAAADEDAHSEITTSTRIVTDLRDVLRHCMDLNQEGSINIVDSYHLLNFRAISLGDELKLTSSDNVADLHDYLSPTSPGSFLQPCSFKYSFPAERCSTAVRFSILQPHLVSPSSTLKIAVQNRDIIVLDRSTPMCTAWCEYL